jgi:MarR family transcriptional regulator, organic hydroperoxide resistance regulator
MKAEETADYHIKTAWHAISRMYNVYAAQYDMTMAIGYVLLNIDKKGTPATKIAPALGLEARSLTRMLKSLDEKGWIRRETDSDDKRIVKIFLTDEGKKKRDIARQGVIEFNIQVLNTVGQADLDQFVQTLSKILKIVDGVNQDQKAGEIAEWELN